LDLFYLGATVATLVYTVWAFIGRLREEKISLEQGGEPFPNEIYFYLIYKNAVTIILLVLLSVFTTVPGESILVQTLMGTLIVFLTVLIGMGVETITRLLITQYQYTKARKEKDEKEDKIRNKRG